MAQTPPNDRFDLPSLPGNVDIINHIRDLKSIEDVHAYCEELLASRFEDQDGDQDGAAAKFDFEAYKERVLAANPPPKFITFNE